MELYYEGKNITDSVNITGAVARDASGGRSDSLTVTLDHASSWYRWGPKKMTKLRSSTVATPRGICTSTP